MGYADGAELRRSEDADGVDGAAIHAAREDFYLGDAWIEIFEDIDDVGDGSVVEWGCRHCG